MKNQKKRKPLENYGRYSSIAIQMAIIIAAGIFGGVQLDKVFGLKFPVFTLVFSLASVSLAIYQAIKDFLK